jgi:glycine amidinotransferase
MKCEQVNAHAEWHPLKEVIVGIATGAQVPTVKDESLHAVSYGAMSDEEFAAVPTGPYPKRVIEESQEDLDRFAEQLEKAGVVVHRPPVTDFTRSYETPDWRVDGHYAYCPRDTILTVGNTAIEAPMALRHRQNEARIYRGIVDTIKAPRPRLLDGLYDRSVLGKPTLANDEPVFDAANCLKVGRDILFLISNTGNEAGACWLREFLGAAYRVHSMKDIYSFVHVDSTIVVLRPGLVLLCPTRVKEENVPEFFRSWDRLYAPEPNDTTAEPGWGGASKWIGMNCLGLGPDLVAVEKSQENLMRVLERHRFDIMPVQLRHTRTLGGGPHCVTLDLVREGTLEDYS